MSPIKFRRAAKSELRDAAKWYAERRAGLGGDFIRSVNACLGLIQNQPGRFPVVHRNIRRDNVKRFPYSVFYLVVDGCIIVLSVFHTSRNPEIWKQRY